MTLTAPAVPHNAYGATETEIGANNGSEAISLWMRYASEFNGPGARLTPDQARTLAADLIARANEIEPPAPALAPEEIAQGILDRHRIASLHDLVRSVPETMHDLLVEAARIARGEASL
jgi:hypothetical protein